MIYLIQNTVTTLCKIGYSAKPKARLATLQTGCADTLCLVAVMPGDAAKERALHKHFNHLRVRGEWFSHSSELAAAFEGHNIQELLNKVFVVRPARRTTGYTYLIAMGQNSGRTKRRVDITGKSEKKVQAIMARLRAELPWNHQVFATEETDKPKKER